MTFEEVYNFLYKKYKIVSFDYSDKTIKAKDSITISTFDLFDLIEGLKETYAPKIKMGKRDIEILKSSTNIVDFWNACTEFYSDEELACAWLHPELIEVSDD